MTTHLLTGSDPSIVRSVAHDLIDELVGSADRSIMVDEFDGDEYEIRQAVDAAQTLPFLTDKRVVVARGIGRFDTDAVAPLLQYLENPLESSDLVLVAGGGTTSRKLTAAVKAVGTVVDTTPPRAKQRNNWVSEQFTAAGLRIKLAAAGQLGEWLGENTDRLEGIVETMKGTFGADRALVFADIEPFLGEAGSVPPWDLTDAIDQGRTSRALVLLGQMMHSGDRHSLQILASLRSHYVNVANLDGVEARNEQEAAAATGIKPYPAKKALANYRRLGRASTKRAIDLLAQTDLDLRGTKDLPDDTVMEVLVARLSKLGR